MKIKNNPLRRVSLLTLLVSAIILTGCDCDDDSRYYVESCNGKSFEELEWAQDLIEELNEKEYKSNISSYYYRGEYVFFVVPVTDPSFPEPCYLYDCEGNLLCEFIPGGTVSEVCNDFIENSEFIETVWKN